MSDDVGQVIEADFTGAAGTRYRLARSGYCAHRQKDVDPDRRTVTCSACRAQLDAFDCLAEMARARDRREQELQRLLRMTEAATARLEELLRLERNARARVRRLGE